MDPTVEFAWSRHRGLPVAPADWAIQLLERGHESEAIRRLTDRNLDGKTQDRLIAKSLDDVGRSDLLDPYRLRRAYESQCIADYFAGRVDGWTLIQRGCELYWEDEADDPARIFWVQVADDADEHGGQGICLQYPFAGNDFDQVLQKAIRDSGRPLPGTGLDSTDAR